MSANFENICLTLKTDKNDIYVKAEHYFKEYFENECNSELDSVGFGLVRKAENGPHRSFLRSIKKTADKKNAMQLYELAANSFKSDQDWISAGHAFCRSAQLLQNINNMEEAAEVLEYAAECMGKTEPTDSIPYRLCAVEIYNAMVDNPNKAKTQFVVAETYEHDLLLEKAIPFYEVAAETYFRANMKPEFCLSLTRAGTLYAILENYENASNAFKQAGSINVEEYVRFSLFKRIICNMFINLADARELFNDADKYPINRPEQIFLGALYEAIDNKDEKKYEEAINDYSPVSPWLMTILARLKKVYIV